MRHDDTENIIFYTDLRAFGRGFDEYIKRRDRCGDPGRRRGAGGQGVLWQAGGQGRFPERLIEHSA
jgi:hypothetical protein